MEINPNDVIQQDSEPDICAICHETMEENIYEIPECKHKYHINCIIDWFRLGKSRCPYCNTNFSVLVNQSNNNNYGFGGISGHLLSARYKDVYNYSRKKNANKKIIKKVKKITDLNKTYKEITKQISDLKKSDDSYKNVKSLLNKLRTKKWAMSRKIWTAKKKLLNEVNIVPVLIRKEIEIN
jgi:hypothetical protein